MPTAGGGRQHGISTGSFHKYKSKFGGMEVPAACKLKALQGERSKLKLLAEQMLDITVLKDVASRK